MTIGFAPHTETSSPSSPSRNEPLQRLTIRPKATVRTAIETIDRGASAIALMVDDDRRLVGTVTDGDVRRALLGGASLTDPVLPFVNECPVVVHEGADRAGVLDLMRARRLERIPEIDRGGRLIRLHVLRELLGAVARPNAAVVLAGGRGTRLGDLTATTPKPMLPVAGRPILERIVLHLAGFGIERIHLSVNYLADQIEAHFGDGSDFGVAIEYLREDPATPLGTGGPLRLLHDQQGSISQPLLVMNGDLVSSFSVAAILDHHADTRAGITVALRDYVHDVPFGVVRLDQQAGGKVIGLDEKPRWTSTVNAGIYIVEPELLSTIPSGVDYPITELLHGCMRRGITVSGWQLEGEWHDVGRPREFARARGVL